MPVCTFRSDHVGPIRSSAVPEQLHRCVRRNRHRDATGCAGCCLRPHQWPCRRRHGGHAAPAFAASGCVARHRGGSATGPPAPRMCPPVVSQAVRAAGLRQGAAKPVRCTGGVDGGGGGGPGPARLRRRMGTAGGSQLAVIDLSAGRAKARHAPHFRAPESARMALAAECGRHRRLRTAMQQNPGTIGPTKD